MANDEDDDIFSTSRSPSPGTILGASSSSQPPPHNGFSEPSDIPRLRSQHSTVGYREGISVAKTGAIQEGFDEGYSLGAVLGLRVGFILGALETLCGLAATTPGSGTNAGAAPSPANPTIEERGQAEESGQRQRTENLVRRARRELDTRKVFGTEYLGDDAVWKWEVKDAEGRVRGEGEEDFTFEDVADSHPLVSRWRGIVTEEAGRMGVDLQRLEADSRDAPRA